MELNYFVKMQLFFHFGQQVLYRCTYPDAPRHHRSPSVNCIARKWRPIDLLWESKPIFI